MAALKTVLFGGAIALTLTGAAMAIESEDFTYASKRTGYLSIAPSELQPGDALSAANFKGDGQSFTSTTDGVRVCGAAPLHLPQGAIVQNVMLQYFVPNEQSSILFNVFRRETFNPNKTFTSPDDYQYLVAKSLTGPVSTVTVGNFDSFADYSKINNEKYVYTLRVCTGYLTPVFSARVKYTYRNAGE